MPRPAFQHVIAGYTISLTQRGRNSFRVQYGQEVRDERTYEAAARDLGECIMHALACEGKINND